jgi:7-cyano-7-deazaguanine synthase
MKEEVPQRRALVLFSGGQDSATCLAWALDRFDKVETIGFDYRQRHRIELEQRQPLADAIARLNDNWQSRLGDDHLFDLGFIAELGQTALTSEAEIRLGEAGLPTTFVPARNLIFLTAAAALAYRRGIKHIVTGVCETDYSGYPDCRDDTIKAMQVALNLGMERRFVLDTPLMWIDKSATWALAEQLGGERLIAVIRDLSHSCYLGNHSLRHEWGYGCGDCPACHLRADGYRRFVVERGGEPV